MFTNYFIKALSVIVLITMTTGSLNSDVPTNTTEYNESAEIIELLKEEVRYTNNFDDSGEDNTIKLTQYEAWLIMQIASAEALNQGEIGMLMVMETIINRINNPLFPNTVYGVISQPGQFSSFASGTYLNAQITPEVHTALAKLESNKDHDSSVIAFERADSSNLLLFFDYYKTYKDHVFYKSGGD